VCGVCRCQYWPSYAINISGYGSASAAVVGKLLTVVLTYNRTSASDSALFFLSYYCCLLPHLSFAPFIPLILLLSHLLMLLDSLLSLLYSFSYFLSSFYSRYFTSFSHITPLFFLFFSFLLLLTSVYFFPRYIFVFLHPFLSFPFPYLYPIFSLYCLASQLTVKP
jgi:hypothetical protein